jgi:hypothetical protein
MDEVKAMTQAGETVGRAVGTGLRTLRRGAVQVGQAGAEAAARAATAAEQKLADGADTVRSVASDAQADIVKRQTDIVARSRKARKQLAKDALKAKKQTRKDLARTAKRVRKHAGRAAKDARGAATDLLATATPKARRRGRRWPWLVGIGVVGIAAGAAYALKGQQQDTTPNREPEQVTDPAAQDRSLTNGSVPKHDLSADTPANHQN